jgi:diamine N-acetyltransferase
MNDILKYGTIRLRAPEPADVDLFYKWENDSSLWPVGNIRTPFSRHTLEQYILNSTGDIYEQKQLRLIILGSEGKPVGTLDLFDFDPYHQRAGIGILIHDPGDRRHGYASDTLAAIENYAVEMLGIRQLYACISEENNGSIRLFQKAGYSLAGIKKKWFNTPRGWKDEWFFQKILV